MSTNGRPQLERVHFADYLRDPAVNWSLLREMRRSPLHCRHRERNERPDAPALRTGRAVHCAVLEPDELPRRYGVVDPEFLADPSLNRATREGKIRWQLWLAEHPDTPADLAADEYKRRVFHEANPGRELLSPAAYNEALAMRDAVRSHHLAAPYLEKGVAEGVVRWTDEASGLACKARPDWLSESRLALVDLKTARDIEAYRFESQSARLGYHCQLAHYHNGLVAVGLAVPDTRVVMIVVENTPPYDVAVFPVGDDVLNPGREVVAGLLEQLRLCRVTNNWPGRYREEQPLALPRWLTMDDSDDLTVTVSDAQASYGGL